MSRPFIVVVTGRPGSGKTTLAHELAKAIHCPALCRDEVKEGYVNTMRGSHESLGKDVNLIASEIFFQTVSFLLAKNISLVIEAAFQHKVWHSKLHELAEQADIGIVICSVDAHLARSRFIERGSVDRTRERFHGDQIQQVADGSQPVPLADYVAPALDMPTMTVDTSDGYSPALDVIMRFVSDSVIAKG